MFRTIVSVSLAAFAAASCDNGCSGHGVCECAMCACYDNWGMGYDLDTGDCSDRICPFEFAWVDTPDKEGRFHKYAECANKGICNRETGECECFEGYEGKGCQRTSCPNDCSGHGTCEYIENLGLANSPFDQHPYSKHSYASFTQDVTTFVSYQWSHRQKTRGCVCDPEYGDIDCSKRMCAYGNDLMDKASVRDYNIKHKAQTQHVWFLHDDDIRSLAGQTFALTFKSKLNETFTTTPITFTNVEEDTATFVAEVQDALLKLPNRVIDDIEVHGTYESEFQFVLNITFVGDYVQGPQNMLVVEDYQCGDGCTPKITGLNLKVYGQNVTEEEPTDYNSYECGRRGKCDYDTGLCQCFSGFTGASCNSCTAMI